MLQVLLEEKGVSVEAIGNRRTFEKKVYPSFMTYNIKHAYQLKWELCACA